MNRDPESGSRGLQLPRVAVSSCLLGQPVRYDGGNKYQAWLVESLGRHVQFQPECPEAGAGLGVPRPPVQLVRGQHGIRVLGVSDRSLDVTGPLESYGRELVPALTDVCGFIFKTRSPSCGPSAVPVFDESGSRVGEGSGLVAGIVCERMPNLPVEDEEGLADPQRRDNFLERLFVFHRWRTLRRNGLDAAALVDFHTRHKFLILAHNETRYRSLGPLVASAGAGAIETLANEYETQMMAALKYPATPGEQVNVMQHLAGFLKDRLDPAGKRSLLRVIDDYREGRVSLHSTRARFREWVAHDPAAESAAAVFLEPYPAALAPE
ncbi:MAG: DUF523 and DUF1722 domain-containing protein [Acidiferrobacteraceae bacterium]|jgi:uncharacterized protein YbgA (DUF1722 family)/uncharacterized protein YbbK (DUF523 family)